MRLQGAALIVVWSVIVSVTADEAGPVVLTSKGKVSGFERLTRGGRVYQGWTRIPYAQPPLKHLRFLPPQIPKKWEGILDATKDTPACYQKALLIAFSQNVTLSEDCLYLNVYRPKETPMKRLPVLVYIHGGGFTGGSVGGRPNADYLMDEDVVLVEVNYRVNFFGFVSLNDNVLPGNNGMKDQVRALEWIKYNIRAFGGDGNNITVFGESAGGASAHFLLKSPLSKDLVKGAVSHSGTINPVWSLLKADTVKNQTLQVGNIVGCKQTTSVELVKCLEDVEAAKLLDAFNQVNKVLPKYSSFAPVIEPNTVKGAFATEDLSLIPTSKPWINTFTNGEYLLFVPMLAYHQVVEQAMKDTPGFLKDIMSTASSAAQKELAVPVLEKIYFTQENVTVGNFTTELAQMMGDECFTYPALVTTEEHRGPRWLGVLEYPPYMKEPQPGEVAYHAATAMFYFNITTLFPETTKEPFVSASKRIIKYLVNFAYHSDPTPPGSKFIWPQFKTGEILRTKREGDIVGDLSYFNYYEMKKNIWNLARGWQ